VHETSKSVAGQLEDGFPSVVTVTVDAEADVLAYFDLLKTHRVKLD
jgi:hypothetical protein